MLDTSKVTLSDGTVETVYTWPTYIKWMIDGAKSKGATPIISSQTPNNPFEGVTTINYTPGRVSYLHPSRCNPDSRLLDDLVRDLCQERCSSKGRAIR